MWGEKMFVRMRSLREEKHMTKKEAAQILDVTEETYAEYECGHALIPPEKIKQLALHYQTSIDYLVGLTDDPRPYKREMGRE